MAADIELREVTFDNLHPVCALSATLTPGQKECVADNVVSVAQGLLAENAWIRAVYSEGSPVGFLMVDTHFADAPEEDHRACFLWRFMIARAWQRKGLGSAALHLVIEAFRAHGYRVLYTSCEVGNDESPLEFYLRHGFEDTGETDEGGEEILRLPLSDAPPTRPVLPMAPRIALVTVWTDEMDPMKRFYTETLGFLVKSDLGEYVELENNGVRFAICRRAVMAGHSDAFAVPPAGQRFELAFPCSSRSDVDATYESLIAAGAGPVAPPQDMPWNQRTALFADPDGNIHEVFADLGDGEQEGDD